MIDVDEMLTRIGVQPPYFALKNLSAISDGVACEIVPEQPLCFAQGPVTTSEAGRHLAILGSCAAAQNNPEPTYYLATNAHFTRFRDPPGGDKGEVLMARAEVIHQDRHTMRAHACLSGGQDFIYLDTEYQVISKPSFERLFRSYRVEGIAQRSHSSPYALLPHLVFELPSDDSLVAVASLSAAQCAGHFPLFPSWPLAFVGYEMERVIERLLHYILDRQACYTITRCTVKATKLISVSDELEFHVRCSARSKLLSKYAFTCNVLSNGTTVVRFDVELFV